MDDARAAQIRARVDEARNPVIPLHTFAGPVPPFVTLDCADLADLLDERDRLLTVVETADEYESVLGRFGIDVGGPLTRLCAAVRAYRATTGEAGQ